MVDSYYFPFDLNSFLSIGTHVNRLAPLATWQSPNRANSKVEIPNRTLGKAVFRLQIYQGPGEAAAYIPKDSPLNRTAKLAEDSNNRQSISHYSSLPGAECARMINRF